MSIWITSDTHFGHKMLSDIGQRKRNFEKGLFNKLMNIPADDLLIHLGDVLIGKDSEFHEKYIKPLKCKNILIIGNHDRKNVMRYMNHGRDFACNSHVINIGTKHILLTHKPCDRLPEGRINLHGHRHQKANPIYSESHFLYSPELENYFPRELKDCFRRYE